MRIISIVVLCILLLLLSVSNVEGTSNEKKESRATATMSPLGWFIFCGGTSIPLVVLTLVLIFYHRYRKKKLLGAKLITTHSPEAGVWSSWAALSSSYDDHDQPEIRVKDQGKSVHIGDKLIATTKRWVHIIGFGSFGLLMFASGILLLFNNHIPQGIIVIVVGVIPLIIALYYTIPIIYVCFSCNHIFGIPKLTGKIKLAINPINMMGKSLATVKYICPYCRSHDINIITIKSKLLPKLTQ